MKIHYLAIVILVISGVVLGMTNYLTDVGVTYDATVDLSGLDNTNQRLEDQQATAQDLSDEIVNMELESVVDFFNIPYVMIKIGWLATKNFFSSWVTVGTMVTEVGTGLDDSGIPLPGWVIPTFITLITTIVIAIVGYAFFKWNWSD